MRDEPLIPGLTERDWSRIDTLDRRHWADAYARSGPEAALQAAATLRLHMSSVRPEWPTEAEREADVEHHVAFKRLLDRAASVAAR